ncbi:MAG: hypothetical protein J7M34_07315 [Anaerolineae bacterium]|nr:hypothetical protein [Anaerolineae bacterium]
MSEWGRRLLDWVVGRPEGSEASTSDQEEASVVVHDAKQGNEPDTINDAQAYGVRIVPVKVDPAQSKAVWRVRRVHHLTPEENGGRHHIFIDMLDENGKRIMGAQARVTWPNGEQIVTVDKPANEPGTNFPMWKGQVCSVEGVGLPSDRVENLHTNHPDEAPGNTLFHHSFLVIFQRTPSSEPPAESVVTGRVHNGAGRTVLLTQDSNTVAQAKVSDDETFRIDGIAAGVYKVQVAGTNVVSDPIRLDGYNAVQIELTVPSKTGVIEGWIHGGAGREVIALRDGEKEAGRSPVAEDESFRIEGLGPGTYVVAVEGTSVRSQPITLAEGTTEMLELSLFSDGGAGDRPLAHYVLLGPAGAPGERANFFLAIDYLIRFRLAFGYSTADAQQAARVTIIGDGYSAADEAGLKAAGCKVERISGGPDAVRAALAARIAASKP